MKVNNKVLCVPPYISTSWIHVEGLYMKGATLVVNLSGGESVSLPGLNAEWIKNIFEEHAKFLEQETISSSSPKSSTFSIPEMPLGFPGLPPSFSSLLAGEGAFHFGIGTIDGFGSAMEHNPAQANSPDIPVEILEKIGAIVKIVTSDDIVAESPAVKNCNCPHCQITRVIVGDFSKPDYISFSEEVGQAAEKAVSDQRWQITQVDENLFAVVDRHDQSECKVYLGAPIGCTCGKEGCEHVIAVLKS